MAKTEVTAYENLTEFLGSPLFEWIPSFLGNGFVSACAGAFAGAVASGLIARRAERKSRLEKRLFATNSAAAISISILNNAIGFKKQFGSKIVSDFQRSKRLFESHFAQTEAGALQSSGLVFEADFNTTNMFHGEFDSVEKLVLTEIGGVGRIQTSSAFLSQSLNGLASAIQNRNSQIELLSSLASDRDQEQMIRLYFGFDTENAMRDARLSDSIDALEVQLNGVIHYSLFLAVKLAKLSQDLNRELGDKSLPGTQFSLPEEVFEYLPSEDEYPDFKVWD